MEPDKPKIQVVKLSLKPTGNSDIGNSDIGNISSKFGSMEAMDYSQHTLHSHILEIPDTYLGSFENQPADEWILHLVDGKFTSEYKKISVSEAERRTFIEILSNASDNVFRSRSKNIDPGTIDINMNETNINIRNGGIIIPIEKHPKTGLMVPEMIFGVLLTSSNYDPSQERFGCGRNGYGAKITNIFSKSFSLSIGDSIRRLKYTQLWENNMYLRHDPIIESYDGEPYVEINYVLDFARFGKEKYDDDCIALFTRFIADVSFTCKVPITLNSISINYSTIKEYAKLYFSEKTVSRGLYHFQWRSDVITIKDKSGMEFALFQDTNIKDLNELALVELGVFDTPDEGISISFVNGIMTQDGGVHADSAYKLMANKVLKEINKEEKDRKRKLDIRDLRPHISIIINCQLKNPKFSSQTKRYLYEPAPKIVIPDDDKKFKIIEKWDLMNRLYASLDAKLFKQQQKTDGRKRRHVDIRGLQDANHAGQKESYKCALCITEGTSAAGYVLKGLNYVKGDRDYIGIFPIRGKMLNVMNATVQEVMDNEEITKIKGALGLREGFDYKDDKIFDSLRYGKLYIFADSDVDGKHIVGLVINLFFCRFPSLLERGYVYYVRTPIIRYNREKFYTLGQYNSWVREQETNSIVLKSDNFRYFKGLGSNNDKEIKDDFIDSKYVQCVWDDKTSDIMVKAFDDENSDIRKEWILNWGGDVEFELNSKELIPDFINKELITYSMENLTRCIPKMMDGFKNAQRKALWGVMKKKLKKAMRLDLLTGAITEVTKYHHGPASINGTVAKMAQSFVGTNNIAYFTEDGNFGTRDKGGMDMAAARYPATKLRPLINAIYNPIDENIYDILIDEGEEIEPQVMFPIIPMILVNGATGIATGFSTHIPSYHPIHLITWIKNNLNDEKTPILIPWYRGFKGTVEIVSSNVFRTIGIFKELPNGDIEINDLPIGRWTNNYRDWLKKLISEKTLKDFVDHSTSDKIYFRLKGYTGKRTANALRLQKTFNTGNMYLLDQEDKPKHYKDIYALLNNFVEQRLEIYTKRRNYLIEVKNKEIDLSKLKQRFIQDVINKIIIIFKKHKSRPKDEVIAEMKEHGYPKEFLKIPISQFTDEKIEKLTKQIEKLEGELRDLLSKTNKDLWMEDLDIFTHKYFTKYEKKVPELTYKEDEIEEIEEIEGDAEFDDTARE